MGKLISKKFVGMLMAGFFFYTGKLDQMYFVIILMGFMGLDVLVNSLDKFIKPLDITNNKKCKEGENA